MKNAFAIFVGGLLCVAGLSAAAKADLVGMEACPDGEAICFGNVDLPDGETIGLPAQDSVSYASLTSLAEGQSFRMDWSVSAADAGDATAPLVDISAEALFIINSLTAEEIVITVVISNTTSGLAAGENTNVLSFGFGTDPDTVASVADSLVPAGVFTSIGEGGGGQQNFPGGFKGIDVCAYSAGCSGGGINTGLMPGFTDVVSISLSRSDLEEFDLSSNPVITLAYFPIKFQGTFGSFEVPGDCCTDIPTPAPVGLLGAGLLGLGLYRRRYRV